MKCLGVFPNPAGGWVSLQKGSWDFFGSERMCITLEHRIQLFHSLNKSSDCRSDISDFTWPHCERKMHPTSPPFSLLKRWHAGEGSEKCTTLQPWLGCQCPSEWPGCASCPHAFGSFSCTVLPAVLPCTMSSCPGKIRCLTWCWQFHATRLVPGKWELESSNW